MIYQITEEEKLIDGFSKMTVYGIVFENQNAEITRISDISSDKVFVENIIKELNRCNVSQVHFKDIVEDFVARQGK